MRKAAEESWRANVMRGLERIGQQILAPGTPMEICDIPHAALSGDAVTSFRLNPQHEASFLVVCDVPSHEALVAFEGRHETLRAEDWAPGEVVSRVALALSERAQLRGRRAGRTDYRWDFLTNLKGDWVTRSSTVLVFYPWLAQRPEITLVGQNSAGIRIRPGAK